MDHFKKLRSQIQTNLFIVLGISNVLAAALVLALTIYTHLSVTIIAGSAALASLVMAFVLSGAVTTYVLNPLKQLQQAILHVAPGHNDSQAPDLETIKLGRELVKSLALEVYQMASQNDLKSEVEHRKTLTQAANIVSHLPLPMFVFNKQQIVVNASDAAMEYCHLASAQLFGKRLYDNLFLEFSSSNTLEQWVIDCQKNKVTDTAYWQRVHVRQPNQPLRQCDIAAYYNRDNPSGTEFIVTLFDRTKQYNQEDDDVSFIALAVHELRTPLTMLRGYIEVFEEELEGKLDPELTSFMRKMIVAAQQLAAFFNNILNVARIDQNQLTLSLAEASWSDILTAACKELDLKAQVHDQRLIVNVSDQLPTVAVDRYSIIEVINNLIDNAIKYNKAGESITIDAHLRKDGLVETTVQDHGAGIPPVVVANLFDKFYRSHRTSGSVGGTGLGLYLSKAIVNAHGGEIWVQSTEGEGSTFGFTLIPASQLAAELKTGDNKGIVRNAHGWIKNHSLYRR